MFWHNFKYSIKTLFRNKEMIFWTFAFPIILGTFFNLAFSNIENSEKLQLIDIAIVNNEEFLKNDVFKETFETLSDENNQERLFKTKYVSLNEARELLDKKDISGYLLFTDGAPKVVVATSGQNQTILKYVTEEISQTQNVIKNIITDKMQSRKGSNSELQNFYNQIIKEVSNLLKEDISLKDNSNNRLSYMMIEFYTLIAMTCLYGGMLGFTAINQNLANMSNNGKRVAVSPIKKKNLILSSALAGYLIELLGLALLFLYTIFVLKIDYGSNVFLVILLTLVGSFAGLSLGVAVASLLKSNENVKIGIILTVTMVGYFLSGMMGVTMKYIIDKNIPILNQINPANMITDGFYSLYYYDTYHRYFINIISLLVFSLIMILLSINSLRRQKYDSI